MVGEYIFVLVVGGVVLALAAAVLFVVRRAGEVKALAERGVDVQAVVVRRFRSGAANGGLSRGRRIEFHYVGPDGRSYTRYHSASLADWGAFAEGAAFPIVCLPDDPGVSAARQMIVAAREALARRKHERKGA